MAITNTHPVGASYAELRLALLRQLEFHNTNLYFDTADHAHPTIGIGFNLDDPNVMQRVFAEMHVSDRAHQQALTDILALPGIRSLPSGHDPGQRDFVMQQALDAYLVAHPGAATNADGTNRLTFSLTDAEMNRIFNLEADDRQFLGAASD